MQTNCDVHLMFGKVERPAVYDAPTREGPWSYLCQECYDDLPLPLKRMATKLQRPATPPKP